MKYVIAIEPGNDKQAWGVVVPDLPGCFSAGDTMDEAVDNAHEAIMLHLESLLDDELPLPEARPLDAFIHDKEYSGWMWAVVSIALEELDDKVERVNITVPTRVLRVVDRAAAAVGANRSAYLVEAAMMRARTVTDAPQAMQAMRAIGKTMTAINAGINFGKKEVFSNFLVVGGDTADLLSGKLQSILHPTQEAPAGTYGIVEFPGGRVTYLGADPAVPAKGSKKTANPRTRKSV